MSEESLLFRQGMIVKLSCMMASRSHWLGLLVSSNWEPISLYRICENRWDGIGYIWNWTTSEEWSHVFAIISRTWVHWGFPRNHLERLHFWQGILHTWHIRWNWNQIKVLPESWNELSIYPNEKFIGRGQGYQSAKWIIISFELSRSTGAKEIFSYTSNKIQFVASNA